MFIVLFFFNRVRSFRSIMSISMDIRFKTPANFYICGMSQSRKTSLIRSMLKNLEELFHPIPTQVIYCFGQPQKEFNELIKIVPKIKTS